MIWFTTAEDNSEWDASETDFISNRNKQPARPTTPITTTPTSQPTTHDQRGQDDDDTLLLLSQSSGS